MSIVDEDRGPDTPRVSTGVEFALERVSLAIERLASGLTEHEADVLVGFGGISAKLDDISGRLWRLEVLAEGIAVRVERLDNEREVDRDDPSRLISQQNYASANGNGKGHK